MKTLPQFDPEAFMEAVIRSSGGSLHHPTEVRMIVTAALPSHCERFDTLCFKAKFLVRSAGILRRLPPRDETRDAINRTFREELENVKNELFHFMNSANRPDECSAFMTMFFSPSIESFSAFMEFLHDLSMIQNMHVDEKSGENIKEQAE